METLIELLEIEREKKLLIEEEDKKIKEFLNKKKEAFVIKIQEFEKNLATKLEFELEKIEKEQRDILEKKIKKFAFMNKCLETLEDEIFFKIAIKYYRSII